jgi:predicted phage terminase large subunit-like protein
MPFSPHDFTHAPPFRCALSESLHHSHIDDLTGFVLENAAEWTVLKLAAIAQSDEAIPLLGGKLHHRKIGDVLSPTREPLHILNDLKRQLGSDYFSAQHQQEPVPPGGAMIKRHWVQRYSGAPPHGWCSFILQSWDTAAKGAPDSDYSVCTTWHQIDGALWYLIDVYRERIDYPTLKAKVVTHAEDWRADQVLIEEAGTAIALIQELQYCVAGITAIKPERDKEVRMSVASAVFEAGQVYLPTQASWLPDLEAELFAFPGSRHDDQIDSISQALNHPSTIAAWLRFGAAMEE